MLDLEEMEGLYYMTFLSRNHGSRTLIESIRISIQITVVKDLTGVI